MIEYFKIIRPINLLIIVLTQCLLRFCIIDPLFSLENTSPALTYLNFVILVFSTLFIAAGGYVINDLYNEETDTINKPEKQIVGNKISPKNAWNYYIFLTGAGLLSGFYLAFSVNYFTLGFIHVTVAIMLWYYSIRYQRLVFWGNFAIAVMSGMVVLIVWIFEFFALRNDPVVYVEVMKSLGKIHLFIVSYTIFAFLVSLLREILKDIEDIEGDLAAGFSTIPIKFGINKSKLIIKILIVSTMILLGTGQYFLYLNGFDLVFWYLMIAVQPILGYLFHTISKARKKEDFHFAGNTAKIVMVAGILSMQLFSISF